MKNLARPRFDLVIFDLDGTLLETAPGLCDALNDTLAGLNLAGVAQAQVAAWIGMGTRELVAQGLAYALGTSLDSVRAAPSLDAAWYAFGEHYRLRCTAGSRLFPQVIDVLQELRRQHVGLAVVTNKESHYTDLLLAAHGLKDLLDAVVSGDTLPTRKPAPDGILWCLRHFSVPPDRALFVGDSSIDVATARNSGIPVWVLPYGYNMGQPVTGLGADRLIDDLRALLAPKGPL